MRYGQTHQEKKVLVAYTLHTSSPPTFPVVIGKNISIGRKCMPYFMLSYCGIHTGKMENYSSIATTTL
jgi:hypothetical protein